MSEIKFDADAALAKLAELAEQHGTPTVKIASDVERISAIGTLGASAIALVIAIVSGNVAEWAVSHVSEVKPDTAIYVVPIVISMIVCLFSLIGGGVELLNIWNWVALVNPKLAVAHRIMKRLSSPS